jgi:molecular chaperone HscB
MSFDFSSDYFSLFSLPASYTIDAGLLMDRYREMQQSVHPDRFANASEQERLKSLQMATHLNEALRVLKNPIDRARYLLELKGVQWDDEQSTISDPEFLMQQMELRERLDEVRHQSDPQDAVASLLDEVAELLKDYVKQIGVLLESDQQDDLLQAKNEVRKMQFLDKMRQEVESLEADIEDGL